MAADPLDVERRNARTRASAVGDGIRALPGAWTFGGATPSAFDSHVVRSIPAYAACHELIVDLAEQLVPPGGRCYDLGCSTGTLTRLLAERLTQRGAEVVGIDREPGMTRIARRRCAGLSSARIETADLEEIDFEPADLAVAFYTLQFVPIRQRRELLERLRPALEPAGALILFEKVLAPSAREQEMAASAYLDWKRRQGFSDEELAAKARSLRGVLQPQSPHENEMMLERAGFTQVTRVFRWVLFDGVVARA